MHCEFSPEFKLDCLREIISIVRSGDVSREQVLEIAEHAACFIGCGAKLMRGTDGPIGAVEPGSEQDEDVAELAAQLEQMIPAEGAAASLPWLQIVQVLLPLLLQLLKK